MADEAKSGGATDAAEAVTIERRGVEGRTAWLVLNRPERRNPMSPDVMSAFAARVAELRADSEVRCVVVTGAGDAFCAGADLDRLAAQIAPTSMTGPAGVAAALRALYRGFTCLLDLEVPTIAAVNGAAYGGGLGLAMLCDMRVAAEEAKLAANFVKIGIHPGMALSYLLPEALGLARAADLLFTGRAVGGAEAAALGLVSRAVPRARLTDEVQAMADEIAANAPIAVRLTKRTLRGAYGFDPRVALELESWAQGATFATEDAGNGLRAAAERKRATFEGR